MRNIKLLLQYDGTDFRGWQSQKQGERTVQDTLEEAVERFTGQRSTVHGSGRTDSGVHALAQVAAFDTLSGHPVDVIKRALNAMLPPDLRVLAVEEAEKLFHPRKNSISKRYTYLISNTQVLSPFARRYSWHVPQALDLNAMDEAAMRLVGKHDFSCFMAAGSDVANAVRNLRELSVFDSESVSFLGLGLKAPEGGRFVLIEAEAPGFLRHMVRNISGTLVEVGRGAMEPSAMGEMIESRDRNLAGPTAPPHGLFMVSVEY
jgi:tRNA pseudouridine38-40 synthase